MPINRRQIYLYVVVLGEIDSKRQLVLTLLKRRSGEAATVGR